MSVLLTLVLCTQFAASGLEGKPGQCLYAREFTEEHASMLNCQEAARKRRAMGEFSYAYGVAGRTVRTNVVMADRCEPLVKT